MIARIPGRFRVLGLIWICMLITYSNSGKCSNCSSYLDPFKCTIKEKKCIYTIGSGGEKDCVDSQIEKYGVTFNYSIRAKKCDDELLCIGCCCSKVSPNATFYMNNCINCTTVWSEQLKIGKLIFTGNKTIMEEAINNEELLEIHKPSGFPSSIMLCPNQKKTNCKLPNLTDDWTIIAGNKLWRDYFENSIKNGSINVKHPNDVNIKLAIMRENNNATQIYFVEVTVDKKNSEKCQPCQEPGEFKTALPDQSSTEPSRETQTLYDNTTNATNSGSQTPRIPASSHPSSLSSINNLTTNLPSVAPTLPSSFINRPKTPKDNSEPNLAQELNKTANKPEKRISVVAEFVGKNEHLKGEDLVTAVKELSSVKSNDENVTKDFAEVVNHVASKDNMGSWENLHRKRVQPSDIMNATDSYLEKATRYMKVGEEKKEIRKKNVVLQYGSLQKRRADNLQSHKISRATVNIPKQVLLTTASVKIRYSFVYYETLAVVMKNVATSWNEEESQSERLNSPILSISIYPRLRYPLKKNIDFTLYHNTRSNSRLTCAYWDFSYKSRLSGYYGRWETKGCYAISQNQSCTTCSCNHLTNFALLMSVTPTIVNNRLATIISLISGSLSTLSVLITIACYTVLWPNITQNPVNRSRAIILMNLCIALLTANIIFLAGSHQSDNKAACKVISALLHFFYLAVFFSMLMEGIDMFITVILVFSKKIKVQWFILGIWIFPLLIVGISFPVRYGNYGSNNHCWLSVEGGLRWAFTGPAFFIIFVNTVILIIVISRMLRTREMMQKTVRERIRTGARGIALLSPVLGFTWIAGFFLVTEHPIMQYIFIICHSLQGIFIFLLHCLFSRQVREGFCQWLHKQSYFNDLSNSSLKCAVLDQTNVTRTMSTAQSLDDLDSYNNKLSEFQPRKSVDFLIPGK